MKRFLLIPVLAVICLLLTGCGSGSSPSLDYIPVKTSKNAKWGFIGPDGKMLYEDEFENKPSVVINGYFYVEENNGISVYKARDKKPELVPGLENLVDAGFMFDGLMPVTKKNERIKLVDASGKEKLTFMPVNGNEIIKVSNFIFDGLLTFKTSEDKWGAISKSGKVLVSPKYDILVYLLEGFFMATTYNTNGEIDGCYLLDKNGKEIKKFKDRMRPATTFVDGKALMLKGDDEIPGYINHKGEFTKLPGKVHDFGAFFDGKNFSFETEDEKFGLMNLEGEVIIRPRYEYIGAYSKGKLYVKNDDERWSVLDKSGNKEKSFNDFEYFTTVPQTCKNTKFEVIAAEKDHQIDFYTFDGEPVTQESFYDADIMMHSGNIETDYFNAEEIGIKMAELVNDNGVNNIALGSEINKLLPDDANAKDYNERYFFNLTDIAGYKWNMSVSVSTDSPIASAEYTTKTETYWMSTYTRKVVSGYHFNQARVFSFVIKAQSEKEFADKATATIVADLKKRGFKERPPEDYQIACLAKGNIVVGVYQEDDDARELYLVVGNEKLDANSEPESDSNESSPEDNAAHSESVKVSNNSETDLGYLNMVTKTRLTDDDLKLYSKTQLRLMRNTIYAVHGRKFKSADLQKYFNQFSWYTPTVDEVPPSALSDIESANLTLIQKYE